MSTESILKKHCTEGLTYAIEMCAERANMIVVEKVTNAFSQELEKMRGSVADGMAAACGILEWYLQRFEKEFMEIPAVLEE